MVGFILKIILLAVGVSYVVRLLKGPKRPVNQRPSGPAPQQRFNTDGLNVEDADYKEIHE